MKPATTRLRSWIALALCWLACATAPAAQAQDDAPDADPLAGLGEETDTGAEAAEAAEGDADDTAAEDREDSADEQPAGETEPTAAPEPAVRTELAVGMGVGTRSFVRPTIEGM